MLQSRPMSKNKLPLYFVILLLVQAMLACSLVSEAPPTLAPSTPLSTITPAGVLAPPTLQSQNFVVTPPASTGGGTTTAAGIVTPASLALVDAQRMMFDIQTLVSFETRHIASTSSPEKGIGAARNYLMAEFEKIRQSSPYPDLIQVFPQPLRKEFNGKNLTPENIIMAVTGTDAAAGVVVVTAHYDTISQNFTVADNYQPGANDNGSGVAAVLELARIVVQQRYRATIVFVLFSAEETGRDGSQWFVEQYIQPLQIPVVAVLNLDIIGSPTGRRGERYDNQMRVYSAGPNESSSSRQIARMVQFATSRYLPEMSVEVQDRVERSGRWGDHMSFSDKGYPAVRLIEAADDATIAHTPNDTDDRIDPNYLRRTTQATLAALELLAMGPNAPTLKPLYPSSSDANTMVLEWSHNPFCATYLIALRRPGSLIYDEIYPIQGTSVAWGDFKNYESVTVGCIDSQGNLGRFAPELIITPPVTTSQ